MLPMSRSGQLDKGKTLSKCPLILTLVTEGLGMGFREKVISPRNMLAWDAHLRSGLRNQRDRRMTGWLMNAANSRSANRLSASGFCAGPQ